MQAEAMEIENTDSVHQQLLQKNSSKSVRKNVCFYRFCSYKSYGDFATSRQMEELTRLKEESQKKVDENDSRAKEELLELYRNAFPDRKMPSMRCIEWKEMGFQSENPYSDLRSCGDLCLQNVLYFSDHQQTLFSQLVQNTVDYPLIASAFNITTILLIHLHISEAFSFCPCCGTNFRNSKKIPLHEMASFAFFLEDNSWEHVFNELFCLGVLLMDNNYRKRILRDPSFTILNFRDVFAETKNQIMYILRKDPTNVYDIFDLAKPLMLD